MTMIKLDMDIITRLFQIIEKEATLIWVAPFL